MPDEDVASSSSCFRVSYAVGFGIVFALAACSALIPSVVEVTWSTAANSTSAASYSGGFFLLDHGDSSYKFNAKWCTSSDTSNTSTTSAEFDSDCSSFETNMLIFSIVFGVGALVAIPVVICVLRCPTAAFFLSPIPCALQCVGLFGFSYRVLPLLKSLLTTHLSASSVTPSFTWAGWLTFGSIGVSFLLSVAYMLSWKPNPMKEEEHPDDASPNEPISPGQG